MHVRMCGPGGMLSADGSSGRVIEQLQYVLARLPEFARLRESRRPIDPYFQNCSEPFAVWATNISTGKWGWVQPISIVENCNAEIYWQTMPDEAEQEVMDEFYSWWNQILDNRPDLFVVRPEVTLPMRWLPGCSIPVDTPLVREFATTAVNLTEEVSVEGLDTPSDMFIFQRCFDIPALMWGPRGANAHRADEYVEVDSVFLAARVLLHFLARWCELDLARTT